MSTKVFVGNLAFRTTDQGLSDAFKNFGKIKNGVIITRGRRSLGYGFVEFENAADAAISVEKMNGHELFGRSIKVELANDISDRPPRVKTNPQGATDNSRDSRDSRDSRPKPPRVSNNNRGNNNNGDNNNRGNNNNGDNNNNNGDNAPRKRLRRRPRKPKNTDNNNTTTTTTTSQTSSQQPVQKPARKPRVEPDSRVLSDTTVFVANLPFTVDDDSLAKIFSNTNAINAHVVKTKAGRSRGYGFVEFATSEQQMKAIESLNNTNVESGGKTRAISVSVSYSPGAQGEESITGTEAQ